MTYDKSDLVLCVVTSLFFLQCARVHSSVLGSVHGNGTCTHNFQVMTLDDNIQYKLYELQQRIDTDSLRIKNDLLTLENRLLSVRNVSDEIQRELLKNR